MHPLAEFALFSHGLKTWLGLACCGLLLSAPELCAQQPSLAGVDFFEARIRPLLREHCWECHGSLKQENGLRLDGRAAVLKGGDRGPAARPSDVEQSLLLQAVGRLGDLEMPPDNPLSRQQVDDLRSWIAEGLPWPDEPLPSSAEPSPQVHWAFQAVRSPTLPEVRRKSWAETPVDIFLLHKMEQQGLQPSERASREDRLRRATVDLLGIPPTAAEMDAFVHDASLAAYERLVDRLLGSPAYGVRWGRHWLDVARYADNKGYVFFEENDFPWAWTYRDWVIASWNRDLPYDSFVMRQLAADRMPDDMPGGSTDLAALGFLTVGARFMGNVHDITDDRIDAVTRGLMGLTVTCARCHDHKFDPIPQEDYYSLYGVFRSSVEPLLPPLLQPAEPSPAYHAFAAGMEERLGKLQAFIDQQRQEIMQGARQRAGEYLLAVYRKRNQPSTENFMLLTDKGALNPAIIHRWEGYLKRALRNDDRVWSLWHALSELPEDSFAPAAAELFQRFGLASSPQASLGPAPPEATALHPLVHGVFQDRPPESMEDVARQYGELLSRVDAAWLAHRERPADTVAAVLPDPLLEELRQVLYGPHSPAVIPQQLGWGFLDLLPDRPTQEEYKKLLKDVETWSTQQPQAPPRAMVVQDAQPLYDPVVFLRGNPHREGAATPRRFLKVLSPPERPHFVEGSGRKELAEAIVDPANPLTARVIVNRVWQWHFGSALVDTPSDFGLRSHPPTHPELLDWLAADLVAHDWSLKHLHRQILLSAAYQQTATPDADTARRGNALDPTNRLYWRGGRKRLDYEAMRDALLAVSGAIDPSLNGPPVNALEPTQRRRTAYAFVDRMNLPGLMRAFDFPEPAASSPGRETTMIPPQALFFLNHPLVRQAADWLIQRPEVSACASPTSRIRQLYGLVFARDPAPEEIDAGLSFLRQRNSEYDARVACWSYGFGGTDDAGQHVAAFRSLSFWTGERWQVGPALPDPEQGWVFIDQPGGHPGEADQRCAIRRWTAPRSAEVDVSSVLNHTPAMGNGVRARVISSRHGLLGQWIVAHQRLTPEPLHIAVEQGDTLDFVADWQGEITHDEHQWIISLRMPPTDNATTDQTWNSAEDFRGPQPDPWVDYAQALLMTNEFLFVD